MHFASHAFALRILPRVSRGDWGAGRGDTRCFQTAHCSTVRPGIACARLWAPIEKLGSVREPSTTDALVALVRCAAGAGALSTPTHLIRSRARRFRVHTGRTACKIRCLPSWTGTLAAEVQQWSGLRRLPEILGGWRLTERPRSSSPTAVVRCRAELACVCGMHARVDVV